VLAFELVVWRKIRTAAVVGVRFGGEKTFCEDGRLLPNKVMKGIANVLLLWASGS